MHRTSLFITALLLAGCNAAAPPRLIANPGGPAILPLTPPARQSCGLPERFDVLPVAMAGRQPLVKIAMDSATATMVLDTGANSTVVTSAFASRFNARAAQPAQQVITQGVDGRTAVRRGFVETLGMGTATLRGVNVNITPATLGPPAQPLDGLLGLDLLGLYDATYPSR